MQPQTTKCITRILKSLSFVEFFRKKHNFERSGTLAWPPLIFNEKVNNKLFISTFYRLRYIMRFSMETLYPEVKWLV